MSRKHRRSRPALTKQLATKRDLNRLRNDILSAIVHASRPVDMSYREAWERAARESERTK